MKYFDTEIAIAFFIKGKSESNSATKYCYLLVLNAFVKTILFWSVGTWAEFDNGTKESDDEFSLRRLLKLI